MLAEDRALLARVATLNRSLGEVTVRLLGGLDPDEPLPPAVLRELAGHIELLAVQLRARTESLATTVDTETGAAGGACAGIDAPPAAPTNTTTADRVGAVADRGSVAEGPGP